MAISAGTALAGAGAISGLVGGGKNKGQTQTQEQIQGFQSFPKEVQDELLKNIFPRIQEFGQTPFATVPYRRAGEAEFDPIFGSRGLQDLQRLNDQTTMQRFMASQNAPAPQQQAPQNNVGNDTASALEFLSRARSETHPRFKVRTDNIQGAEDISSLAKLLDFYKQQTGGQSAQNLQGLSLYAQRSPEMRDMYYNMVNK